MNDELNYYKRICEIIEVPFESFDINLMDRHDNPRTKQGEIWFTRMVYEYENLRANFAPGFRLSTLIPGWNFSASRAFFSKLGRPFTPIISPLWESRIDSYFGLGNTSVARRCGLDLESFDYPMSLDTQKISFDGIH